MKKAMVILVVASLLIGILLVAGCGGSSIEGTYEYRDPSGGSATLTLGSGTCELFRRRYDGDTKKDSGTYKVNGTTLTCYYTQDWTEEFKIEGNNLIDGEAGMSLIKQ